MGVCFGKHIPCFLNAVLRSGCQAALQKSLFQLSNENSSQVLIWIVGGYQRATILPEHRHHRGGVLKIKGLQLALGTDYFAVDPAVSKGVGLKPSPVIVELRQYGLRIEIPNQLRAELRLG